MILPNMLPVVGRLLQRRYSDAYRARLEAHVAAFPDDNITAWPKRRVRRKPFPGAIDAADPELG